MNKLSLLLLPFPLAALADGPTVLVPEPLFFENREAAQMPSENLPEPAPAAPLSDGLSPQDGLEAQINHAVFRRDWQALPPLLARYRNLPARDQTLYDYALGALRRAQLRHKEAIALYRGIVGRHPDLAYPRFDLGVMLFEDRQYRAAEAELQHALPDLSPEMQNIAGRYLAAVREAESWQPDVSLQYEATDNVNNAADARFIEIDGKRWQKTADSLPQRAHGLRYGASVSREKNLGGHHYAYAKLGGDGVAYWDNHDFDEQSLNIAAGYKNHSAARSFGLVPFAETNWLGGSRYNRADGGAGRFFPPFRCEMARDAECGICPQTLSGAAYCRALQRQNAAGGSNADVCRAKGLAVLRRSRLVARHDQRRGAGIRAQGHTLWRGKSV